MRPDFSRIFLNWHSQEGLHKLERCLQNLEISISDSSAATCSDVEDKDIPLAVTDGYLDKPHGLITSLSNAGYMPGTLADYLQTGFMANTL